MEGKSIEDVILERYTNELTAEQAMSKRLERSPYQLPLGHSHILSSYHRTPSACNSNRSHKSRSIKVVSERSRSNDLGRVPPHTPKDLVAGSEAHTFHGRRRNNSASGPIIDPQNCEATVLDLNLEQNDQDLLSAKGSSAHPSRSSTGRRKHRQKKPTYLLTPDVYVVTAYKNGDTSTSYRISASNLERLLEECTQRMSLASSARKLFLSSGKEVTKDMLLPRGTNIYVSMGEPFKDPLKVFEKKLSIKADMQWTLTGLNLPSDREKESTRPVVSSTRLEGSKAVKRRILAYPNGKGVKGIEVIADMTNTDDFMQSCASKLKSGHQFKRILLMDGKNVTNLHNISEVHPLLNTSGAPLLGPVWLSKGESISPLGVEEHLREAIDSVRKMKAHSDAYLAQLNSAYYCDDRSALADDPQLTDKRILSMTTRELEHKIAKETDRNEEYVAFLKEYREKLREVEPKARSEQEEGSQFTMKHIAALPENHRLVSDRRGIRLRVYKNGRDEDPATIFFNVREASRGLNKDKERTRIVFQRFLDSLSTNPHLASQNNKSKSILVQRVFTKTGKEITDALQLQYDDEIWISHGENWVNPFTYCLQAEISRVTVWKKGSTSFVVRSDIPLIDDSMERPSAWETQWRLPDGIQELRQEVESDEESEEERQVARAPIKAPEGSVTPDSCFLQHCRNKELCMFVEPVVGVMRTAAKSDDHQAERMRPSFPVWPNTGISQVWVVHKTGQISIKGFPNLALAVSDCEIQTSMQGAQVRGILVQFSPYEKDRHQMPDSQQWIFHTDGLIYSKKFPDLALTYLGGSIDEPSSCPKNELDESEWGLGYRNMLAACQPFEARLVKFQRFGMRQQKLGNLGQVRKAAKFRDPAWSKMAIVWPTDHKGNWIEDFDWPIEGYILPFAPPMKYRQNADQPKRFFCLKNGDRKEEHGMFVVAPDLTNMRKDRQLLKRQTTKSRRVLQPKRGNDADSTAGDFSAESDQKVSEVEFQIFLEYCTEKLGLSMEAQRLFDRNGSEHTSLKHLDHDQIVYISTGEDWIDPKCTKSQLEARALLAKLSDDVEKMRHLVALKRSTQGLALTADRLTAGAKICVLRQTDANLGHSVGEARPPQDGDEKLNKLRWPWETIVSSDFGEHGASGRRRLESREDDFLRQFGYDDDFIYLKEDSSLVVTATDSGSRISMDVTLQRRRPDNVYQRWLITNSGFIILKYQSGSALTIQMPKISAGSTSLDAEMSAVTVQPQATHQFGRAHQLFAIDESSGSGIIRCFATNALDTAVTVANHCGCCTSSVIVPKDYALDQPGYIVYLPVNNAPQVARRDESRMKQCEVCIGCAKSLRGRYKLQKIGAAIRTDFSCAFGQSNALGLKETGAFQLLSGKLDLTDGEDLVTLKTWEKELEARRESLSLKAISERLSEARTPRPMRVLAYRNGDGRRHPPVPVTSSSAEGIMDQCTIKLDTGNPVSRLFLEDGTEVTEIADLRRWRKANAKLVRKRQEEFKSFGDDGDADDEDKEATDISPIDEFPKDDLEPRLTEKYFVIGSKFTAPSAYNLGISLYSMSFLEEILPDEIEEQPRQLAVRYSIFGQTLCTDPFEGEESFEGEKREIVVKSELQILRRYFKEQFRLLKFDLLSLQPVESVLGTCYVPLDSLIREEHEEFINSTKMAADYAWYRKSAQKPKGERTHASMHVEISVAVNIDIDVDSTDGNGDDNQPDNCANEEGEEPEDSEIEELTVEVWASTGEDFAPPRARRRGWSGTAQEATSMASLQSDVHVHPELMRLRVYHNGDDPKSAVTVWAQTVQQALENASSRLGLRRPARILYDNDGHEVRALPPPEQQTQQKQLSPPLYCVSCGEPFQQPRRRSQLTAPPPHSASSAQPPPTFDTKRVLVAEWHKDSPVTVWGDSLEALLKAATVRLKLRTPAVCFYHRRGETTASAAGRLVESFAEISRDARLLVSTTGRPPNASGAVASASGGRF